MMKKWMIWAFAAMMCTLAACNDDGLDAVTTVESSFEADDNGWDPEFAEYSTESDSTDLTLDSGRVALPSGLDTTKFAYMLAGMNRSDDIFMYLKKKVTGLVPNRTYSVVFEVDFGSNYPESSFGAGGSPGSSVYLKAGASTVEPKRELKDKFYHFNLDKGAQSQGGKDAIVLGNIANGREDEQYALVQRSNAASPILVRPNANGELWFFVGTDSGYEGLTVMYYDRIKITITEQETN